MRDVRAAIASGDLATAQRLAHTLKGAAGDIGAPRLSEAAKRMESALRTPSTAGSLALVDAVEALLVEQLANIQRAMTRPTGNPLGAEVPAGNAAIGDLMRELAKMLRADDAQALELLAPLTALVRGSAHADEYRRLIGLVERFSLHEALSVLQGIASNMDITLD